MDECQVTLIEAEALETITSSTDVRVAEGQHRRNVVVRGVELRSLAGATFTIGEARFAYDRPRPPWTGTSPRRSRSRSTPAARSASMT